MLLGIDYGRKRIGLALGELFPKGAGVIDGALPMAEIVSEVERICSLNGVDKIVIGLPIRSGGEEGELGEEIKKFAGAIKAKTGLPVVFESEELTSYAAEQELKEAAKRYPRKSGKIDELAAIFILEQHINNIKR